MKRLNVVLMVTGLWLASHAEADFSDAQLLPHPVFPHRSPFVLELWGTWEGSCHPGIADPVVTRVEGTEIEIDLVLDPLPPCLPEVESPYRVLVDMSQHFDVADLEPLPASDVNLDVTFRFLGNTFTASMTLGCFGPNACPSNPGLLPDPGLYHAGLAKQGLLLARQGQALAAYPLVYDDKGSAEWLFAGGTVNADTYFAPLYQASGGQCLGCPPPDEPPSLETVGHIAMVFDSEGKAQVKIDDGPFIEYHAMEFGYGEIGDPATPNLEGRWALVETAFDVQDNGSIPPGAVLPLVFDIGEGELVHIVVTSTEYDILGTDREVITTMICGVNPGGSVPKCELRNPDFDDGSHSYLVEFLSPERIRLTDTGPMLAVGTAATGIAVRID